ncbi:MAG TPA: hypothetical protein VKR30_01020 [Candidatus Limnocylindrales bacterium]|nr:hypothetical protein [Candidatus Limnocylindrales bacterium]
MAKKPSDGDSGFGVRLATHRVRALREVEAHLDMDVHGMVGEARVDAADLVGVPADYRSGAQLEAGDQNLTRGWVSSARLEGTEISIQVGNSMMFDENILGQLSVARVDHNELAWSMAMWFGAEPVVPGLRPIRETIAVAMPIIGLELTEEINLGPVRITADRPLIEIMGAPLNPSPEKEAFLAAGVWAVMRIEALLLYVADDTAVPAIETAIDRLALEIQFSMASSPDGTVLPFERTSVLTDPTVVRTTLAHGHRSGRTWMRSVDNPPVRTPASARRVILPATPSEPGWADAVRAWRRAVRESDRLASVGALFEAVEFYASATKTPDVLTRTELKSVESAIDALPLGDHARKRLSDVLAMTNQPPLLDRLHAALEADQVPFSAGEIDALWRLRKFRNKALHGSERGTPDKNDLEIAYAFVNRMLVFRGWGAREPPSATG